MGAQNTWHCLESVKSVYLFNIQFKKRPFSFCERRSAIGKCHHSERSAVTFRCVVHVMSNINMNAKTSRPMNCSETITVIDFMCHMILMLYNISVHSIEYFCLYFEKKKSDPTTTHTQNHMFIQYILQWIHLNKMVWAFSMLNTSHTWNKICVNYINVWLVTHETPFHILIQLFDSFSYT